MCETYLVEYFPRPSDRLSSAHAMQAGEEHEVLESGDPQVERPIAGRDETDLLAEQPGIRPWLEPCDVHNSHGWM